MACGLPREVRKEFRMVLFSLIIIYSSFAIIIFMDKAAELRKIEDEIRLCKKCSLYKTATNPVPGAGSPDAKIVFIGEAPGYYEDKSGIPFVGRAGKLLDEMLNEINLKRQDIFITNILKHRPPNNRDPQPDEIKACSPFLYRQLSVIKPKIIITLGRFAMNFFLPSAYISRVHGRPQEIGWFGMDIVLIPLYHPAAALRNGSFLEAFRKDFLQIPSLIKEIESRKLEKVQQAPKQESLF